MYVHISKISTAKYVKLVAVFIGVVGIAVMDEKYGGQCLFTSGAQL